jgi:hypothetical protein
MDVDLFFICLFVGVGLISLKLYFFLQHKFFLHDLKWLLRLGFLFLIIGIIIYILIKWDTVG